MSHQTKRPFDSVECSTPHDLLIRCSLSNLQFPAIALTWCGLTSHRHRSIEPFFMSLAARDSEFRRWSGRVDRRICQTFAASPAEPGELPLGFRAYVSVIVLNKTRWRTLTRKGGRCAAKRLGTHRRSVRLVAEQQVELLGRQLVEMAPRRK
jgi:hypothetical protein